MKKTLPKMTKSTSHIKRVAPKSKSVVQKSPVKQVKGGRKSKAC